jgi:hypothetical protein
LGAGAGAATFFCDFKNKSWFPLISTPNVFSSKFEFRLESIGMFNTKDPLEISNNNKDNFICFILCINIT